MWVESAPSSHIEGGRMISPTPPSTEDLYNWYGQLIANESLQLRVWQRFLQSRHHRITFIKWLRQSWFFKNAPDDLIRNINKLICDLD